MSITINSLMQQRRDTASNWSSANPTLLNGELGYETDTGKWKVGNGSAVWTSLAYTPWSQINAYPITTANIADNAITAAKIANTSVTAGSYTTANITVDAQGRVTSAASGASAPPDGSITTAKLADDAVTGAKLANDITIANNLTVTNDLTVNGTTTTIDSTTLVVEDKNIEIGKVSTPTDVTADGGGITLKGATDKTLTWVDSTDCWTFNQGLNLTAGTAGAPALVFNGDVNSGLFQPGADSLAIATAGTQRVTVDSSGQVGIGTSTPGAKLHLAGGFLRLSQSGSEGAEIQLSDPDGTTISSFVDVVANGLRVRTAGANKSLFLGQMTGTGGNVQFYAGASERLRIDSSGRLLVGTTSAPPVTGTEVPIAYISGNKSESNKSGALALSRGSAATAANQGIGKIEFIDSAGAVYGRIQALTDATPGTGDYPGRLEFYTTADGASSSSERMRIDSSGKVYFGNFDGPASAGYIDKATTGDLELNIVASRSTVQNRNIVFKGRSNTEAMRIDTSGNVGIRTSSPLEKLDVRGDILIRSNTPNFKLQSANGSNPYYLAANISDVVDGGVQIGKGSDLNTGTSLLTLLPNGNVGIGTTNPSSKLNIASNNTNPITATSTDVNRILLDDTSSSSATGAGFAIDVEGVYGGLGRIAIVKQNSATSGAARDFGEFKLFLNSNVSDSSYPAFQECLNIDPSVGLMYSYRGNEQLRIDSSGRLLVGTFSDRLITCSQQILTETTETGTGDRGIAIVQGGSSVSGPILNFAKHRSNSVGGTALVSSGDFTGAVTFNGSDGTNLIQSGFIAGQVDGNPGSNDMPGRLVFSTTADGAASPTERMRISSDGSTSHFTSHTNVHIARSGNSAGTAHSIYVGVRSSSNNTNGTVVYRVYTNGTYATISDINQKKNIETTRDGYLDDLNQLRVVKYNWNEQEDSDPKELGLIAQEVEQIFPGLVSPITDDNDQEQYKGIKTSVLPYMLLKALQEATERIETLEQRLSDAGIA